MAAPEYVPEPAIRRVRTYASPPRRPDSWRAERPGDTPDGFPRGERLGAPGPDQGYVLVLARRFDQRLRLQEREDKEDVVAGCAAVALKRASLFRRAPVLHDLTIAFTLWGFLRDAPKDLVELRRKLFAEVANPHYYAERRGIADMVPDDVLRRTPQDIARAHHEDWRRLLDLSGVEGAPAG